jgi:hypothetical protein
MSRRLLMLQAQNIKGYFDGYKSYWGAYALFNLQWFSFEKSNQFQLEKRNLTNYKHPSDIMSIANYSKSWENTDPSPLNLPMGYDSNKKYNFRIKVLNKTLAEEANNAEELVGNGSLTFYFKGSDITKASQSINIRDVDQGTEFVIPIEKGEILNNCYVEYISDVGDVSLENYACHILFEIYFEEITE